MGNIPSHKRLTELSLCLEQLTKVLQEPSRLSGADLSVLSNLLQEVNGLTKPENQDIGRFLTALCNAFECERSTCSRSKSAGIIPVSTKGARAFFLSSGKSVRLGSEIARGGEGAIFRIPDLPGKVAKIFHTQKLPDEQEQKLKYLRSQKQNAFISNTLIASFPDELLYTADGNCCGYIMQYMPTTMNLTLVTRDSVLRTKALPDLNYRGLIAIAYNLAEAVAHLHRHNIIIGDMNQNNILVNPDGTIYLIDANSFDVTDDQGIHYPCCVGLSELLAPELQGKGPLKDKRFTAESDCFTLAIHIFRLLMQNTDPFSFIPQVSRSTSVPDVSLNVASNCAIAQGESVFFRDVPGKELPHWAPSLDILPSYIVELFRRTFAYNGSTALAAIANRPTAEEWVAGLAKFYQEPMKPCTCDPFHWYLRRHTECPLCRAKNSPPPIPSEICSHDFSGVPNLSSPGRGDKL